MIDSKAPRGNVTGIEFPISLRYFPNADVQQLLLVRQEDFQGAYRFSCADCAFDSPFSITVLFEWLYFGSLDTSSTSRIRGEEDWARKRFSGDRPPGSSSFWILVLDLEEGERSLRSHFIGASIPRFGGLGKRPAFELFLALWMQMAWPPKNLVELLQYVTHLPQESEACDLEKPLPCIVRYMGLSGPHVAILKKISWCGTRMCGNISARLEPELVAWLVSVLIRCDDDDDGWLASVALDVFIRRESVGCVVCHVSGQGRRGQHDVTAP